MVKYGKKRVGNVLSLRYFFAMGRHVPFAAVSAVWVTQKANIGLVGTCSQAFCGAARDRFLGPGCEDQTTFQSQHQIEGAIPDPQKLTYRRETRRCDRAEAERFTRDCGLSFFQTTLDLSTLPTIEEITTKRNEASRFTTAPLPYAHRCKNRPLSATNFIQTYRSPLVPACEVGSR